MKIKALFTALLFLWLTACSDSVPPLPALPADATILAFGDSLTYGSGAAHDQSYPSVLEELSGRTVINAGVPGEQSAAGLQRLPEMLDEFQPHLLVLCHGGNDMLRQKSMSAMQVNLERMIAASHERGIPVLLLGVPRPALFGLESAEPYSEVAAKFSVPLEGEIIPEVLSESKLKSDQIHPNAAGYRMMAEAVYQILRKAGAL